MSSQAVGRHLLSILNIYITTCQCQRGEIRCVTWSCRHTYGPEARRLIPFLARGAGTVWMRDEVGDVRFWSNDRIFTVGGGPRAQ